MVTNPPSNARDAGLIPGWGTKTLHAAGQLSRCAMTREASTPQLERARAPLWRSRVAKEKNMLKIIASKYF